MAPETGKKWKTSSLLLTAAVVTAAAFAAANSFGYLKMAEGDDNERPPIIVNNGSLEFEGHKGLLGLGEPGTWDGSGSVYKHVHANTGPRVLQVKTSPNDEVCQIGGAGNFVKSPSRRRR